MPRRYDPDDPNRHEREKTGARGRFFFPPTVVDDVILEVLPRIPRDRRPNPRHRDEVIRWLAAASLAATRKLQVEERRRDGRQVWRAPRPFGRIYMAVDTETAEGELPVCVGVYISERRGA